MLPHVSRFVFVTLGLVFAGTGLGSLIVGVKLIAAGIR